MSTYSVRRLWGQDRLCINGKPRMVIRDGFFGWQLDPMQNRRQIKFELRCTIMAFLRQWKTPDQVRRESIINDVSGFNNWLPISASGSDSFFSVRRTGSGEPL